MRACDVVRYLRLRACDFAHAYVCGRVALRAALCARLRRVSQIRQRVVEQLILPLGSQAVHEEAPYVNKALFYGYIYIYNINFI